MRIFDYAVVASWEDRLDTLAGMAEPERWIYKAVPSRKRLPILESYVRYTFERVLAQGKVIETDEYACFNTGLLTPAQEEIFCVFAESEHYDDAFPIGRENKRWFLRGWSRSGDRQLTGFRELPRLATYWTDPGELIFNPALDVQLNLDHIVRENLNRFPQELGGQLDPHGVPVDLVQDDGDVPDDDEVEDIRDDAAEPDSPVEVPLHTRNALEGAMEHSVRLAKRSYRMAVPQFYHGRVQLLLPLYLRSVDIPDLALTLERHGDWYRAATVLYPDWAYRHARLLSRPNSEWLGGFRTDLPLPASP